MIFFAKNKFGNYLRFLYINQLVLFNLTELDVPGSPLPSLGLPVHYIDFRLQSQQKKDDSSRQEFDMLKSENKSLKDKVSELARESESDKLKLQRIEREAKKEEQV